MKKFKMIITAVMLTGALALTACGSKEQAANDDKKEPLFGEFTTMTLSGEEVNQEIFVQSELTMVNIWGTFCGPCIQEMPELGELAKDYEGKMQIVGVIADVAEPGDALAQEIVDYTGADYMHIVNSEDLQNGYVGGVQAVPTTVFLDKEGRQVGETYTGARDKEMWIEAINEVKEAMEK